MISDFLQQRGFIPPEVQAALYRALAKVTSLKIEKNVTDAEGRRGTGIYRDWGLPEYLIFEPGTYRFLGSKRVAMRDDPRGTFEQLRAGETYWVAAELEAGIVDKPGQRP